MPTPFPVTAPAAPHPAAPAPPAPAAPSPPAPAPPEHAPAAAPELRRQTPPEWAREKRTPPATFAGAACLAGWRPGELLLVSEESFDAAMATYLAQEHR